jgi:TonB dependent receptor-like, beta-barrel/Carboxypeptidase regulatory-like domain/TonB-dependent Receptor Plug Domain
MLGNLPEEDEETSGTHRNRSAARGAPGPSGAHRGLHVLHVHHALLHAKGTPRSDGRDGRLPSRSREGFELRRLEMSLLSRARRQLGRSVAARDATWLGRADIAAAGGRGLHDCRTDFRFCLSLEGYPASSKLTPQAANRQRRWAAQRSFMRIRLGILFVSLCLCVALADATIFGNVRGIVHDPQHRPIAGAEVTIKAVASHWRQSTKSNADGEFNFSAVSVGDYVITVSQPGFETAQQKITVLSDSSPIYHILLPVATVKGEVTVRGETDAANAQSVTPTTLVSRTTVQRTPGADRTNGLQMITDYVPGSYVTHDQLHVRGGHQVSWLMDGVPVPNTNIASNLGPQIDPKDIDYLEAMRGSYDAGYGDRTYGVFNVVPRSGFESNNDAELVASFGNFYQTNDQINFGGHTDRFAYFAGLNGNRSNLGLQTPVSAVYHDAENGFGGFGSLIYNADPKNQFRLVTSLRRDYYQIPYDPNNPSSSGLRDGQHESDAFLVFSWVWTPSPNMLLTVSPLYHFNRANYEGMPNDVPTATTDNRASTYVGGQATFSLSVWKNSAQFGIYGFGQHDNETFGLIFNDNSGNTNFRNTESVNGGLTDVWVQDKFQVTQWLTLMGGVRQSHFSGGISENATSPRAGVSVLVPRLHWVFHAFYGHYYQAPPLGTASGPLLEFVTSQSFGFIPLHGERDEEHQFGVTIPFRGWFLDADNFQTRAVNFFDHNNVGNSDIFFPLTIQQALIRGWELTLRSPRLWNRGQFHLAYSNQIAEGEGAITGGLTDFSPPSGYFPLDHDQRNTLNLGFDTTLPWRTFASMNLYYGSGFTNGEYNPPTAPNLYLPGHTTVDLSLGRNFGENLSATLTMLNVANRHLLIDNSFTFGGFHWNDPREIYVELRYRFHY